MDHRAEAEKCFVLREPSFDMAEDVMQTVAVALTPGCSGFPCQCNLSIQMKTAAAKEAISQSKPMCCEDSWDPETIFGP